jgi:hypothetical protein
MDGYQGETDEARSNRLKRWQAGLWFLGFVALLVVGFTLEDEVGIPFATTLRVVCVGFCQFFIHKLGADYPEEQWPRISFWVALVVNIAIFFTPLVDRPASRGELMLFAVPDAIVVFGARIASYNVVDVHQRAVRQQMILGLVFAVALCAILFTLVLMDPRTGHSWGLTGRLR